MEKLIDFFDLNISRIIHLFFFTKNGTVVLFERSCGRWGPISGEIERFENP